MTKKDSTVQYYDQFNISKIGSEINHRHLQIQERLEKFGLSKHHKVLEVGSGAGGPSELILRFLSEDGHLTMTDISPERIELAKQRLRKYKNVKYGLHDFTNEVLDEKFDTIVLPDVIEHIHLELHQKLFSNLNRMLKDDGSIFINIPDPNYLQWLVDQKSDLLQIIDQPIHAEILASNLASSGLYIHYLESYSIYINGFDYQFVILRKKPSINWFEPKTPQKVSFYKKAKGKVKYLLRGKK